MSISFEKDRWGKIRETYGASWDKKLERPIIPVILKGKDPGRPEPKAPLLSQENCTDLTIPVVDLVDRIDYELSKYIFMGDAFPFFNLDCFGPGVVSAFLGAKLDNSTGRVWFFAKEDLPLSEIHLEYDPDNVWLCRVKDICREAMKRWQGQVLMGMPDLGGAFDLLGIFRPAEKLFLDFYDEPDEVKRLTWELHELWHRFYKEISEILMPVNPGYTDWSAIYRDKPGYILQADISYMISPDMFREFVKPELEATCKRLDKVFYHLDGVGQLGHMDALLEIKGLGGVQWVPGDGKPTQDEWPDVQRKIINSGRNIQIIGDFDKLDRIAVQVGGTKGIILSPIWGDISEQDEMARKLSKYGIE